MKSADILITGFGPFPGAPVNVSAELARRLARAANYRWPHLRTVALALETDWEHGPGGLLQAASELRPRVIVMFGISRRATGFHVESCAWNERHDRAENSAPHCVASRAALVCPTHPAAPALHVGPMADRIVARLRSRGFAARRSSDAGRYLCNAALFHGLAHGRSVAGGRAANGVAPASQAVFIHLPPVIAGLAAEKAAGVVAAPCPKHRTPLPAQGNRMPLPTALRGGLEIIAICATHAGLAMRRG